MSSHARFFCAESGLAYSKTLAGLLNAAALRDALAAAEALASLLQLLLIPALRRSDLAYATARPSPALVPRSASVSLAARRVAARPRPVDPPSIQPVTLQSRRTMPKDIEDTITKPDGAAARQDLLKWWDAGHRAMPWRRETPADDKKSWAYGVWVSEVMLQQTQVSRVDPYWRRWMERWPSVESLAQADESDVKALWSGLGYYRRCAFLLEGAKQLASSNEWPTSKDQWLKVKGVGPYTARRP